ncbi:MAG: thiolase family protein, partial [Myxococcaceae bacterium]|nr:thiolase family protein [Myxococcaceae bacterium]
MPTRVAIVSTARTPFTRALKGELKDTRPDTMAAFVIKEALARAPGIKPADVEDIVLGCAMPEAEQGMNVARLAGLLAGLPDTVPAMTINRFCSSGVQSIAQVAQAIIAGQYDVGIAGGVESMTLIPMGGNKVSANPDLMEKYPEVYTSMGATAEKVAARFNVSREEQDKFAFDSQMKAKIARTEGRLKDEIAPMKVRVFDDAGRPNDITLSEDTILRAETTLEGLTKLKPAFDPKGTVTAGNASPLTDGAAAAVVVSEAKVKALGL